MKKELFGVFGDRETFSRLRSERSFDRVVSGDVATVGVRDVGIGIPGRTSVYEGPEGVCVVWGEVYPPQFNRAQPAEWLLDRYAEAGADALSELNGSFLAFVEHDGEAFVATDPVRTRDCFFTDTADGRVFGTDATRVARAMDDHAVDEQGFLEFVHLGVVLGDRTVYEHLTRTPFDGYLTPSSTGTLDRFVYEPREFDYADELARRIERAVRRRADQPGRSGLLLSAGYDSRMVLATQPSIEETYTLGEPDAPEVAVARRLADQYDAEHTTLVTNERYLNTDEDVIRYTQGVRESLHVHHGGHEREMDVDTMYHGLLFDTLLRGYFLPEDTVEIFDATIPLNRLDPDPDPVAHLRKKLGFMAASDRIFPGCEATGASSLDEFVDDTIGPVLDDNRERADSVYNAIARFGIQNQPSMAFHTHLADQYLESFVAVDAELLDWHLKTPPEHRNERTFLRALKQLDDDILEHRPPDRPTDSFRLNQAEKYLRRKLPGLKPFGAPWPDRDEVYDHYDLDYKLFPDSPAVHDLPVRLKLRINDLTRWMNDAEDDAVLAPDEALCPSF
ncbi:asparagine synthase-related protein [Halobacteriaceae archaeon GCM10025711]